MSRRLLLVTHRPLMYEGPGTVRWRYLMSALSQRGWRVEVITSRHNVTRDELSHAPREAQLASARARVMGGVGRALRPIWHRAGIQPEAFPPNHLWSYTARPMLRRKLADFRPDVVVATIPPPAAMFVTVAAVGEDGPPLVVDMRDNWAGHPTYDAGGTLLRRIEDRALRRADAVVAVTQGMEDKLRRMHPWLGDRLHLMPNGYDPVLLARRAEPPAAWPARVTLVHPGVLYGDRGIGPLLEAMAANDLRERVRLQLVGNVDAFTAAALSRRPAGVEVDVLPPLTWQETMTTVAEADLVVVIVPASMGDDVAWPVKMFEAFALGKPILSITSGGATEAMLRELGQDHALARDGDGASIAAALRSLLAAPPPAPVDPDRIARFSRAAVAERYAALLELLVARRP